MTNSENRNELRKVDETKEKLVFIYALDGGAVNKTTHFFKRIVSPSKIECPLYGLTHDAKGIKPEVLDFMKRFGVPYEILYQNEFIQKYEGFEIFGKFKIEEASFPSVYIILGDERAERDIYELIRPTYFQKCESLSCFGKVLKRKYAQFHELGPEEFRVQNRKTQDFEADEDAEKKQKIEKAHEKIVEMEKQKETKE
ncbi:hypothetical protein [Methanolapillus millepedarum]|uniref:Uncharacterized protein n=1 Tax=Methanolapillus millepedarum TaxID=3028296 RepID=A0AA96V2F0_9EURY|nr:hypothetical protein MsAc7_01790 [Methanosarcinaceae archaeon Ac7]